MTANDDTTRVAVPEPWERGEGDRETAVIDAFVDISDALATETDIAAMLARLVQRCTDLLGAAAAGILLPDGAGRLTVLAASTAEQPTLQNFQSHAHEGPCSDTVHTGEPVLVDDLERAAHRWPAWAEHALTTGVRSVYAIPMSTRGTTIGALSLLGDRAHLLTERNRRLAAAFADVATVAVTNTRRAQHADELAAQLQSALASRMVIEQAKGVVATALGITMDEAFTLMRGHSRSTNVRLTHIAGDLANGRLTADQLQIRRGHRYREPATTDPAPAAITDLTTAFPLRRKPRDPQPPTP